MTISHLELGQLWRCPVEWCAVWKGSVSDCLGHFNEKHGGSAFFALKNVASFFPPWTVTWDIWQAALRPDISGHCGGRTAVPCGRMSFGTQVPGVQGPVSAPGAQGGGGGVIPRLLSFVARAMAIAQLTQLHIFIPASGVPPGQVPAECFRVARLCRDRRVHVVSCLLVMSRCWEMPNIQCIRQTLSYMSHFDRRSLRKTLWILGVWGRIRPLP